MGKTKEIINGKRQCTLCLLWKPLNNFGQWLDKKGEWVAPRKYYTARCKPCMSKASRTSALKNQNYIRERNRQWRNELRDQVYTHYGNRCICCGENNPMFLTLDHTNNDGYLDRIRSKPGANRKLKISGQWYKHLIDIGFREDLQLLCYNCNCGKQRNKGVCPHADSSSV